MDQARPNSAPWLIALLMLGCGDDPPASVSGGSATGPGSGTSTGTFATPTTNLPPASTGPTSTGSTTEPALDTSDGDGAPTGSGIKLDVGGGSDPNNAVLTGRVVAPNGEIPIAGALVYVTPQPPAGIPDNVYCDECQMLGPNDFFDVTEPDGTFEIVASTSEEQNDLYLVVKKGQFMRIEPFTLQDGAQAIDEATTQLPSVYDPASGRFIPRIALGYAGYGDRLEDVLAKFGLGQLQTVAFGEKLVPGTESFDIWENGTDPTGVGFVSQGSIATLINDPSLLDDYHIIFLPCTFDNYVGELDMTAIQNIRDWVAAGGRWYASDYSNEWVEYVFPDYQTLVGEPDNADGGGYDSLATILDAGLIAWLDALPPEYKDINPFNLAAGYPTLDMLPMVETVGHYSVIESVHPVLVPDRMGSQFDVGHKVWLEGPGGGVMGDHPLTITGTFGCGRLQFTSYHTTGGGNYNGLTPQELVLLYTILEIGVCQDNPLPPPQG